MENILSTKLSKICGIIYKLRPYVPLSNLKSVYFNLFHLQLQYSIVVEPPKLIYKIQKFFKTKLLELVISGLAFSFQSYCIQS